jgi:hypothetical protein
MQLERSRAASLRHETDKELSNDLFEENSENDFSEIDEQEEIAEEYRPIKDYENYEASNLG